MSKFEYRTINNADPKGKPKVYISLHPDDREQYLDRIINDIFETQNCSIWYETDFETECNTTELLPILMQMQLIVVPVTTKLFISHNRAVDIEIPFAINNKIPLLPLMTEEGLEDNYKQIFGNLQYLEMQEYDETTVPYRQKLSRFLSIVLPTEGMIRRIQSAFDAYIFLSYRKKDRKHAQELMKLIHKNEICRGIAIWYDEFLVPGEDFNDTIDDAIDKCLLFALAITPNIINEINYIMTHEYPAAQKKHKNILPAELIPTNHKVLSEKYKNIPEIVDAYDELQMLDGLTPLLKDIALKTQSNEPEHYYFIGLAYLMGIDVEVDFAYAEKAIRRAAECQLPEAMEKLSLMYSTGDGVTYNLQEAVLWQKKLCELNKKLYFKEELEETGIDYANSLDRLVEIYLTADCTLDADIVSEDLCEVCISLARRFPDPSCQLLLAKSYELSAKIKSRQGLFGIAIEQYDKLLTLYESKNGVIEKTKAKTEMGRVLSQSAYLLYKQNRFEDARLHWQDALSIFSELYESNKSYIFIIEQINCYRSLGTLESDIGNSNQAEKFFTLGINLISYNDRAMLDIHVINSICRLFKEYAFFCKEKGRIKLAKKLFQQIIEYIEHFVHITNSEKERFQLLNAYETNARFLFDIGENIEAERNHQLALHTIEQLSNDKGTIQARRMWAEMLRLDVTARWYCNNRSPAEKYDNLKLAHDIYEKLVQEMNSNRDQRDLAILKSAFADFHEKEGRYEKAEEFYLQHVDILEKLADKTGDQHYLKTLISGYRKLANFYSRYNENDKAEDVHNKHVSISMLLANKTQDFNDVQTVISAYCYKGSFLRSLHRYSEAIYTYNEALQLLQSSYINSNNPQILDSLADVHNLVGFVYEYLKRYEEVKKNYLDSISYSMRYVDAVNTVKSYQLLISRYICLALFYAKRKELKESDSEFQKADKIVQIMISKADTSDLPEIQITVDKLIKAKRKARIRNQ